MHEVKNELVIDLIHVQQHIFLINFIVFILLEFKPNIGCDITIMPVFWLLIGICFMYYRSRIDKNML